MEPHFDNYQFESRPIPVSAESQLTFSDFGRMHVEQHKLAPNRRLAAPIWAFNQTAMRELLVAFIEGRAFMGGLRKKEPQGSFAERLQRAEQKLISRHAVLIEAMKRLSREYVAVKNSVRTDRRRLSQLEIEIQNIDTRLLTERAGLAKTVLGVIWRYYGLAEDSVAVGMALGIRPPAVRQILWRLHRCWQKLERQKREGNQEQKPETAAAPEPEPEPLVQTRA
jgi:hypothetical protein